MKEVSITVVCAGVTVLESEVVPVTCNFSYDELVKKLTEQYGTWAVIKLTISETN